MQRGRVWGGQDKIRQTFLSHLLWIKVVEFAEEIRTPIYICGSESDFLFVNCEMWLLRFSVEKCVQQQQQQLIKVELNFKLNFPPRWWWLLNPLWWTLDNPSKSKWLLPPGARALLDQASPGNNFGRGGMQKYQRKVTFPQKPEQWCFVLPQISFYNCQ